MDTAIAGVLKNESIFSRIKAQDISKLLPHAEQIILKAGDVLFDKGENAEKLFLIVKGSVEWNGHNTSCTVTQGFLGEETALDMDRYTASVTAINETCLISIPKNASSRLIDKYLSIRSDLHASFIRHYQQDKKIVDVDEPQANEEAESVEWIKTIGWLMTMILPIITMFIGDKYGLSSDTNLFVAVFTATISMWIFRLVPEFVPAFFLIIVILILGMVPPSVTLSGFASNSFFMALSIFGLGAVLIASGVTYRIALYLLQFTSTSPFWQSFSLFITGSILTPVLPSANGRISLMTPLLMDVSESTKSSGEGRRFTQMATFTFVGATLFSSVFLSSKSINLVVYGMLPQQLQAQYHWLNWTIAALVFGAAMLVGFLILTNLFFRSIKTTSIPKDQIKSQLKVLGPISVYEWLAIGGISLFLLGILTSSIHKIEPSWIGLAILYIYLVLGSLNKHDFRNQIDWPFLVLLAGMVGMANTISHLGLDTDLQAYLRPLLDHLRDNLEHMVIIIALLVYGLRLFMPNNATVAVLATILIPLADAIGLNAWLVVFLLLTFSDGWFFPYQSTYYLLFTEQLEGNSSFNERKFLLFNACSNILRVVAVYASVPYWEHLGII